MSVFFRFFPTFTLILFICGCNSPFQEVMHIKEQLQLEAVSTIEPTPQKDVLIVYPLTEETEVEQTLRGRRDQLDEITPSPPLFGWNAEVGEDLEQHSPSVAPITMSQAVMLALENNIDLEIASYQPRVAQHAVEKAQAAFDFVFGTSTTLNRNRIPQQSLPGNPFSSTEQSSDTMNIDASLARKLSSGGTLTLSTDVSKTKNNTSGFVFTPNPAWQTVGTVGLNQPLLRNFGDMVANAQINTSVLLHGQALEEFKHSLINIITATEVAYLDLALHWKTLQVREWLLEQSEAMVVVLELRRGYDTGESDYAQAVATVQQRSVDVITQQSAVHNASDSLKKYVNSAAYSLDSDAVIQPTGEIDPRPVSISLREAVMTAIAKRPDLRRLALAIDSDDIQLQVADNARLPQLDLQAQMSFYGLGDSAGNGYNEVFDTDFVNYVAGLSFEVPLGNHAAEADFQSKRLQKMTSTATYRKGIQDATVEVRSALRNVLTNGELMQANRSYRVAQAENLRALYVEEETMSGLTPTFLNLKLQTQSGLAAARISEFTSIVNYNKSIASLYQAMGTTIEMHNIAVESSTQTQPQ